MVTENVICNTAICATNFVSSALLSEYTAKNPVAQRRKRQFGLCKQQRDVHSPSHRVLACGQVERRNLGYYYYC